MAPLYRPASHHSKKGSPLRAYLRATSSFNLTPRPGFSGSAMNPFWIMGFGTPSQGIDASGRDRILEPQKPETFQSACNLDHVTNAVAPVAIDGDVRISANGFVNGANQSNHAINRSICKATVVRIRTFGARHVKIKLQSCVPLRPHRNRLPTVIVRRGWRGPLGLTEIIPRSLLAPVPHPRRLTRTKDFVQVFERFASMAIGIDSYLIPELSAEQSINRYL